MTDHNLEAAKWLVVGYKRSWTMGMLAAIIHDATGQHAQEFGFMPTNQWWYGKAPVRGFVTQNYPKLSAYLDRATGEQLVSVASQIIKLRPKVDRPNGSLTKLERGEIDRGRKKDDAVQDSYRLSRSAFRASKKTAWNVHK